MRLRRLAARFGPFDRRRGLLPGPPCLDANNARLLFEIRSHAMV
jgi:hypothetical protein